MPRIVRKPLQIATAILLVVIALLIFWTSEPAEGAAATDCVDAGRKGGIRAWWAGDGLLVRAAGEPCAPVTLIAAVYTVPKSWDGDGFNASALPQRLHSHAVIRVVDSGLMEVPLHVPECGPWQWDVHRPPVVREVTTLAGHGDGLLRAGLRVGERCATPTPTPTSSPTPNPSQSPTPAPSPTVTARAFPYTP